MFVPFHKRTDEPCVDNLPYAKQVSFWVNRVKYWSAQLEMNQQAGDHEFTSVYEEHRKRAAEELEILADVMWLSAQDIAGELDLSLQHVTSWLESGQIKAVNLNDGCGEDADWLIHRADYEEFLTSRQNVPTPQTWQGLRDKHMANIRAARKRPAS